ncbi:MAG TPA: class I SAM-dependent methyltransferase [Acidimicrobiales bacterium]|nr:class I SAM-dependent methyltransferase [Acidimicrobiales bacterium]
MDEPLGTPLSDVDRLVAELRERVEQRRRDGLVPDDLEEELDEHFRRIAAHRIPPETDDLEEALEELNLHMAFGAGRIRHESTVLGGERFHRAVGKAVARQTHGVLEQVQEFADAVRQVLRVMADALENPKVHVHDELIGMFDGIHERISAFERGPVHSEAAVADLRRRVEQLEEAESKRQFRPWFLNERFEAEFRGSSSELLDRYRDLALEFKGCSPVLDIGCGRGEFLELLAEAGVDGIGVELDPVLVQTCRDKGLDVDTGDGLSILSARPDDSLGGIVLIQVVEHLQPQQVVDLVALAYDKLRSDGRVVIETVNPQSLYVFAHSFYVDPTHHHPVHPAYLAFLFREAGFREVRIDWRSPPPVDDVLVTSESDDEVVQENVRRLNTLLFSPQDYALIATR